MSLWVPPSVDRELREGSEQHRAEIAQAAMRDAIIDFWTRELKKVDEHLEMIKARDDAHVAGLTPGYYHVLRHNPGAPPSLLPIVGEKGEFTEPTSKLLDLLRAGDLQNEQAMAARRRQDEESARRALRDEERETEDRQAEMWERLQAGTRTQVSMNPDKPWAQNWAGEQRTKGKKAA